MLRAGSAPRRSLVTGKRVLLAVAIIALGIWMAEMGWMVAYFAGVGVALVEQSIGWLRKRR
jgi:hypothetical protein